jgi:hypothetical protein
VVTINLISGPRNISTALMYSFAQRTDTGVLDEPFYAVYLAKSGANHPGRDEVLKKLPQGELDVREYISSQRDKRVLFIKNMSHHMEVLDDPWIAEAINVFLIRNPSQIIASYAEVIDTPTMRDIGIEYQHYLFNQLLECGEEPIVVDSGFLVENPEKVLIKLCSSCGIAFEQRMMHWPPGPKPYDGVWATHWYSNVHHSSGFKKQSSSERSVPPHLLPLCERARVFYEKLVAFSLKA